VAEKKFLDFMDRFDGGGMGKSGDKFEGGGLLSLLANAFATPYGSEDRAKEEALAGLLGKTRPNMRPNRPASIAPAAIPAGSAPAPGYTMPGTIAEMSGRARDRAMPLTKASDIPGGFNPANAAPVQVEGSGMTPANNYVPSSTPFDPSAAVDFTMPDGSTINPPAPQPSQEQIAQKFGEDMVNAYGREKANAIMSSPNGQGVYLHYINNGYQLPAL